MDLGRNGCFGRWVDRVRRAGRPPHRTGVWPAEEVAQPPEQVQGTDQHRDLQPGAASRTFMVVVAAKLGSRHHAATAPSNNKMELTLVFDGPRTRRSSCSSPIWR